MHLSKAENLIDRIFFISRFAQFIMLCVNLGLFSHYKGM